MNITSVKETPQFEDENVTVVKANIDGVEINVPKDTGNRRWQAILEWVADGNTIAEAD